MAECLLVSFVNQQLKLHASIELFKKNVILRVTISIESRMQSTGKQTTTQSPLNKGTTHLFTYACSPKCEHNLTSEGPNDSSVGDLSFGPCTPLSEALATEPAVQIK